jgi:hypothetical protein
MSGDVVVPAGAEATEWAKAHRDLLRAAVAEHGAVRVSGFDFAGGAAPGIMRLLADDLVGDREGFAPRRSVADRIYTTSRWPAGQPMCMHHTMSYLIEVPSMLVFACLEAPARGGGTPLASAAEVLAALPGDLVERFRREGWLLTRTYHDSVGIAWAGAFGTDDRAVVEAYCVANDMTATWLPDGGLRTTQRRRAVITHPKTGEELWFNQFAFLNEWTMAPEIREYLVDVYGRESLPLNTFHGDGSEVKPEIIELINATYDAVTRESEWAVGDLLLVDNLRMAHARRPYEGTRTVLVALADQVSLGNGHYQLGRQSPGE